MSVHDRHHPVQPIGSESQTHAAETPVRWEMRETQNLREVKTQKLNLLPQQRTLGNNRRALPRRGLVGLRHGVDREPVAGVTRPLIITLTCATVTYVLMVLRSSHLPRVDGESRPLPEWSAMSILRERFSTQALSPYWVLCRASESSEATCTRETFNTEDEPKSCIYLIDFALFWLGRCLKRGLGRRV